MIRALLVSIICTNLAGCVQSVKEIGQNPSLSEVGEGLIEKDEIATETAYSAQVSKPSFSIWDSRKSDLFKDKIAVVRGDILTVDIAINDEAKFSNQSDSKRTVGRGIGLSGAYNVAGIGSDGSGDAKVDSTTNFKGNGGTNRSESIRLSVAAVVVRVLGNGNLLVRGSQEVRVNSELRVLTIAGIVRPNDIGPNNTISYERIAEARVSYGGRGHISEMQRPPYGQQILDKILPF